MLQIIINFISPAGFPLLIAHTFSIEKRPHYSFRMYCNSRMGNYIFYLSELSIIKTVCIGICLAPENRWWLPYLVRDTGEVSSS